MKKNISLLILSLFSLIYLNAQVTINPCAQATPIHIVVIGSSTAAGTGPSTSDSAWVNRYRTYLQNINPLNQVTNLAIGGTTTYQIMPSWYVAPTNRPATNNNNNVTMAINLGADAIIVNMPSNDAANGFSINEQMTNFITISNSADSSNIPVWVCTTQPRNGFNPAKKAIQLGVRDSIINYFGPLSIDFWNGFADTTNNILTQFDSGDGVHMNDAGHRVLNERVINKEIPNVISDTLTLTDHLFADLYISNSSICGDSNTLINAIIVNLGQSSSLPIDVHFNLLDNTSLTNTITTVNMANPLNACSVDTVNLNINSYSGVNFNIKSYLTSNDTNIINDTSATILLHTKGHPNITGVNDTVCLGDSAVLIAERSSSSDTTIWYDSPTGGNIVNFGDSLFLSSVVSSQTYFSESVRGNLYFEESFFTTSNTTTNFNGIMFDIVALDTITIDSLMVKINSTGQQGVVAYNRAGSHIGNEMNNTAWSLWGIDTIQVNNVGDFKTVDYSDIQLYPNDTLGIYIHMQNSASRLSYQASPNSITLNNNKLSITSGSGIAFTYGTSYYPRNWSGEVFYHHGFNPNGDCVSPRIPVNAIVSHSLINLGADTILDYSQSIILNNNSNFSSYLWSNNDTSSQLLVDTNSFNNGNNVIWLQVTDPNGCSTSDTITVTFDAILTVNKSILNHNSFYLAPNPTNGKIKILGISDYQNVKIELINSNGIKIDQFNLKKDQLIDLKHLSKGFYFISFNFNGEKIFKKIILN